jgi:hypothetical protein
MAEFFFGDRGRFYLVKDAEKGNSLRVPLIESLLVGIQFATGVS